ncbi:hypothetical protein MMC30_007895 [Trapelia coarctata]|nr:hypothetical protein [Trapelia coarctata]
MPRVVDSDSSEDEHQGPPKGGGAGKSHRGSSTIELASPSVSTQVGNYASSSKQARSKRVYMSEVESESDPDHNHKTVSGLPSLYETWLSSNRSPMVRSKRRYTGTTAVRSSSSEEEVAPSTVDNLTPKPATSRNRALSISQTSGSEQSSSSTSPTDLGAVANPSKPCFPSPATQGAPAIQGGPPFQGVLTSAEINFHFFLSDDPTHGAIAKPASACLTPEAFFNAALLAWKIGSRKQDPVILAVKLSWEGAKRVTVVLWKDCGSFTTMMSAVTKAAKTNIDGELDVEVVCIPQM